MGKYRVYVYTICKDEEKFAARWYDSMREADGVYALDTGSTDRTVETLRALGACVEEARVTPWRFDTARNRSLALVPEDADICVCTDLDERFTPGWRERLEDAWKADTRRARYKYVWSFAADGSEDVVFYADKIHARHGYEWRNPVHEVLICQGEEGARALCTGMQLNHYPDPNKSRAQYLPLLELAVREDPDNDRNRHYLGREYLFYGRWDDCIRTLKAHLRMPQATWADERCASLRYMAQAYRAKGNRFEQERCLLRAAGEAPYLREPWVDLARMAYESGDWPQVLGYCRRAFAIRDRPRTYMTEASAYGALPFDLLSLSYYHLGLRREALRALDEAIARAPQEERLRRNRRLMEREENAENPQGTLA